MSRSRISLPVLKKGHQLFCHRHLVAGAGVATGARLPTDLSGRYANADTAATWTIVGTETGAELRAAGLLMLAAEPWEIEPIEGDAIRIYTPLTLYRGWLDTRVLRGASGRITGLHVDGGRVKGLVFTRVE